MWRPPTPMIGSTRIPQHCAFPEDVSLALGALSGRQAPTEALGRRLACVPAMLRSRARALGGHLDPDEVDELSQEVLTAVWARLGSYAGDAPLEGWVHAFVVRIYMRARHRPRAHVSLEETPNDVLPFEEDETVTLEDEYRVVHRAVESLRSTQAYIVHQRHFEERSFEDIAEELSMPRATVKTKYYRGLERLRSRLDGFWTRRQRTVPRMGHAVSR